MYKSFFCVEFPSSLDALPEALRSALQVLLAQNWIKPGQEFFARLCLEEALVNAITHGNKCDQGCTVRVEMSADNDHCRISVFDRGPGFRPEEVVLPDAGRAGGRGLCLIRHYMENVVYNPADNCLEMTLRRNAFANGGPRS